MLALQDFIMKNENWKEKLSNPPYSLIIKEKDSLVLFKYTQGVSDFNEPICNEARGIILEKGTWKVVRIAFNKFFNLGEEHAADIDWETAVATEKMDGSLISFYWYNGKWRVATNGCIDAEDAPCDGAFKTFKDLIDRALEDNPIDFKRLNKNITYTFELCTPHNQQVVEYKDFKLYLILVRNNNTLDELNIYHAAEIFHLNTPKQYPIKGNVEDFKKLVETFGDDKEGIVVKDKNNKRVKIKTETYFQLHHWLNNGNVGRKRIFELLETGEDSEFLAYFPRYVNAFARVAAEIYLAKCRIQRIENVVADWKNKNPDATKKQFSEFVNLTTKKYQFYFYRAYDYGKIEPPEDINKRMKFYRIEP